mmetsp:Transcript_16407/g.46984  ORF Transcript_16407/g.46984 Transcript_16407/m.46984 type:complete len:278 (+) Transcript_16407:1557-2390(+)
MDEDTVRHDQVRCNYPSDGPLECRGDRRHLDQLPHACEFPRDLRRRHHRDLYAAQDGQRVHKRAQNDEDLTLQVQLPNADGGGGRHVDRDLGVAIPIHADADLNAMVYPLYPIADPLHMHRAEARGVRAEREVFETYTIEEARHSRLQVGFHLVLHDFPHSLVDERPNDRDAEVQPCHVAPLRPHLHRACGRAVVGLVRGGPLRCFRRHALRLPPGRLVVVLTYEGGIVLIRRRRGDPSQRPDCQVGAFAISHRRRTGARRWHNNLHAQTMKENRRR